MSKARKSSPMILECLVPFPRKRTQIDIEEILRLLTLELSQVLTIAFRDVESTGSA